jgi:serine/threonine protein kinase
MPLPAGTRLGAYIIDAPLGAGGMGEVYEARDTRLDRIVAIKVLPDGANEDPDRRERFRRDARVISSLNDAHICTLYDIGEENGTSFLVMEYLAGETLAHRLARGPLPVAHILKIGAEIARALESAHRLGIVHRDLKPANVMLTDTGAKILDFGIAKWRGTHDADVTHPSAAPFLSTLTQAGTRVGTVQYMAPEQVEGQPVDSRVDVFALGAMLYEMTTGRKAFEGTSPTAVMAAILTAAPPSLVSMQPDIPHPFDRLVRKCLDKDPAKRWQTAADLRDELEWIAQQPDITPSRPEAVPPRVQVKRWVAAGVMVVATIGVLLGWALLKPTSPAAEVTSFEIFPPASGTSARHPTISPDGRKVVFIAPTSNGQNSLWVRRFDTVQPRILAEADELAFPFWSPDSQSVGFFAQGRLQRVSATGGVVQSVCVAPAGRGGTWGRDSNIVFAASSSGGLSRVSAAGGTPQPVTTLDALERSHRFRSS